MPFSRIVTILLSCATVVWGLMSVQAAAPVLVEQTSSVITATPVVSTSPSVTSTNMAAPTIVPSAESTLKPVVSTVVVSPTVRPAVNATPVAAPTATVQPAPIPVPTSTATPKSVVMYVLESAPSVHITDEIEVTGTISVGELTKQIANKHNTSFLYDVTDQGWFVTELADVKNNPRGGFYWFYYVNGSLGNTSVDQYVLKPGDTFKWLYDHTL